MKRIGSNIEGVSDGGVSGWRVRVLIWALQTLGWHVLITKYIFLTPEFLVGARVCVCPCVFAQGFTRCKLS